ncbi:putative F-box protein [Cardamine amara subsp. amara]|uniref:F-box protein n=1 Tax=Cardamine amara subsp. amara TaxID=228776 RepID=A0ABD0ZW94_CARAN
MESVSECSQAKRQKIEDSKTILRLPEVILHGIFSDVANHSLNDIASAEVVSKRFGEIMNDGFVRKNLTLREVPLFPLPHEMYCKRFFKFMKLCRKSDNHEAIFRKGLINFFHMNNHHQQQIKGQDQMEKRQKQGMIKRNSS